MSIFAADDFSDTDAVELASHTPSGGGTWTEHASYGTGVVDIQANRARASGFNNSLYYISPDPGGSNPAEYDVAVDLVMLTDNGGFPGVAGRIATGANTYYWVRKRYNDTMQLFEVIDGTSTQLENATGLTDESGRLTIELRDDGIRALWNAAQILDHTTTNDITAAGKAGLRDGGSANGTTTGIHWDNFEATDLASAGVEGDAAIVLPALQSAATAAVRVLATASVTLPALAAASSVDVRVQGTASATLPVLTAAATGAVRVLGAATLSLPALTASGTAGAVTQGSAAITLGALQAAGTATVTVQGTAGVTLPALTAASTATVTVQGSAAVLLPALTASGTIGNPPVTGTAAAALPALTAAATGTVRVQGSAAFTLPALAASGTITGLLPITGSAAFALPPLAASGSGTVLVTATATLTLPALTATGSAGVRVLGTAAIVLPALTVTIGTREIFPSQTGDPTARDFLHEPFGRELTHTATARTRSWTARRRD